MRVLCIANFMKLNVSKTRVIPFTRKTYIPVSECNLYKSPINCTGAVKDLGVFLDSKLYFHQHVN
jgi:hypothetical protein